MELSNSGRQARAISDPIWSGAVERSNSTGHPFSSLPDRDRTAGIPSAGENGRLSRADLIGPARWLLNVKRAEEAVRLFRWAVDLGLPDNVLFKTLWEIASIERRLGHVQEAITAFGELAESRNPYRERARKAVTRLSKCRK